MDLSISKFKETLTARVRLTKEEIGAALNGDTYSQSAICVHLRAAIRKVPKYRKKASNEPLWPGVIEFDDIRTQLGRIKLTPEAGAASVADKSAQPAPTAKQLANREELAREHPGYFADQAE